MSSRRVTILFAGVVLAFSMLTVGHALSVPGFTAGTPIRAAEVTAVLQALGNEFNNYWTKSESDSRYLTVAQAQAMFKPIYTRTNIRDANLVYSGYPTFPQFQQVSNYAVNFTKQSNTSQLMARFRHAVFNSGGPAGFRIQPAFAVDGSGLLNAYDSNSPLVLYDELLLQPNYTHTINFSGYLKTGSNRDQEFPAGPHTLKLYLAVFGGTGVSVGFVDGTNPIQQAMLEVVELP